ncbi:MAG: Uma2 family endonuclease [Hyphomicrobiaceae bacterium]
MADGTLAEDDRFELIGGEIVPMSPRGIAHEAVRTELSRYWFKALPDETAGIPNTTLHLGERDFLEPDFVFWPRALGIRGLTPSVVQLLVEISDSSLEYDLGRKAAIYAGLGLPDYWVIDARKLTVRIHREPQDGAFRSVSDLAHTDLLTPLLLPALAVRLADLGLSPEV